MARHEFYVEVIIHGKVVVDAENIDNAIEYARTEVDELFDMDEFGRPSVHFLTHSQTEV